MVCSALKKVTIYTDGGCRPNPGKGGYGVVLLYGPHRKELSGGYRLTTNNRMEILAVLVGLRALNEPCEVTVFSDSQYVVRAIEKGWVRRWQRNGWMRTKTDRALNIDLWEEMLDLLERHTVRFKWVRGHAGDRNNNRCDELAGMARSKGPLKEDRGYRP